MQKIYLLFAFISLTFGVQAQKIAGIGIHKTHIGLRGGPVVLGQVTIQVPEAGKVILRFDGHCLSEEGDRIMLAASDVPNWAPLDGCVELEAPNNDINANAFSHTRAYAVPAGEHTFYAVGENAVETEGSGKASVYGSLTATWYPKAGGAFAEHTGFHFEEILIEGGPTPFAQLTINAPVAGKALVRFDGKCVGSFGDLIFFAANNSPTWTNYEGSTSCEANSNDNDRFSFSHTRIFPVGPGSHTFYGVVENYYEIYGNGFASVYGSLTVEFFPDNQPVTVDYQTISTPFGVNAETTTPVVLGQMPLQTAAKGKVLLNLVGTAIASFGDQVRLAASNTPEWGPEDGHVAYEPFSSERNRVSFSHSRLYAVEPGVQQLYALIQNYEETEGSGLAVVYAGFSAIFFPDNTSAVDAPMNETVLQCRPNPAGERLYVTLPESEPGGRFSIFSGMGQLVGQREVAADGSLDISILPPGVYLLQYSNGAQEYRARFVKQ